MVVKTIEKTHNLILPDPISVERIELLKSKGIAETIASFDLEMVKMKMTEPDEGIGWTVEQCEDAEIEYKRFLTLCIHYPFPNYSIVPNKIMDTMWHYHILDTRAYHRDCESAFGGYFHHFPYFGLRGEEDAINLKNAFESTKELYLILFGESLVRESASDCWHDCENRCWNACSKDDKFS